MKQGHELTEGTINLSNSCFDKEFQRFIVITIACSNKMSMDDDHWKSLKIVLKEELKLLNESNLPEVPDIAIAFNIFVNDKKVKASTFD